MKLAIALTLLLSTAAVAEETTVSDEDIWKHQCELTEDVAKCQHDFSKAKVSWDTVKGDNPYGQWDGYYWKDMITMALKTYAPYFDEHTDADSATDGGSPKPGSNSRSYVKLDSIKARIAKLPGCQEEGTCYRGNELGLLRLNKVFYPECGDNVDCGISLGISKENHKIVRPILDHVFGDGSTDGRLGLEGNQWKKSDLRTRAAGFLANKNKIDVKRDSGIWTTMVLHDIALGMSFSEAEAGEFVDFQAKAVVITALPSGLADNSIIGGAVGIPEALSYKGRLLERYETAIEKLIVNGDIPASLLADENGVVYDQADLVTKLSWGMLDALIFAGGLSVPGVITAGMAAYYTGLTDLHLAGGAKFDIDDPAEAPKLVFECIRNYPPVLGVPYIETSSGFRHAPLAGMGGYDVDAYGADARDNGAGDTMTGKVDGFKIRGDFNYYHSRSIDWADSAAPVDGKPWTNHICPAKSMSYNMILAFWEALGPTNWVADDVSAIQRQNGPVWWDSPVINRVCESMGVHVGAEHASRAGMEKYLGDSCSWFNWCGSGTECARRWWQYSGTCKFDSNVKFLGESCNSGNSIANSLTEKADVDLKCQEGRVNFADGVVCDYDTEAEYWNDDEYRADGHSAGATAGGWLVVGGLGGIGAAGAFFLRGTDMGGKKGVPKHQMMKDGNGAL